MDANQGSPTLWIALTAVFALIAVGLGIWAFSLRSDRDDAQATVDRQQQELATQEQGASKEETGLSADAKAARASYARVRGSLIRADRQDTDFKAEVNRQADELTQARRDVQNADSADDKAKAQLRAAGKERELATACAQGTVDIIDGFLDATAAGAGGNSGAGVKAAMKKLEDLEPGCKQALNG
jgi:hypothetical protein